SAHVLAFGRGSEVVCVVSRLTARLRDGFGTDTLDLPAGSWTDVLTGQTHHGRTAVTDLFRTLPVSLLVRG
ncbi:MAG TPA: hypothetical protein VFK52_00240, partial [Nocardioidaceae bacterium]|nr:hypothetical protein [Nocardioidaceae bacterium]